MKSLTVGFLYRAGSIGGPWSFQTRLVRGLERIGHRTCYIADGSCERVDLILVIGGPIKGLQRLLRCKLQGAKVVLRLDGLYWRHLVQPLSYRTRMMYKLRNSAMLFVRNWLADHVVYQSNFVRSWWHRRYGPAPCPESVIVNGVDLAEFRPGPREDGDGPPLLLAVEGNINTDDVTLSILETVHRDLFDKGFISGTAIYGRTPQEVRSRLASVHGLELRGEVPQEAISGIFACRGIYLSLDINSACPNTVIEALASGLPVVGFDTGALRELVSGAAGKIVPYGGDPWQLERPNISALTLAICKVAERLDYYRQEARALAERRFGLEAMTSAYVKVFKAVLEGR